MRYDNSNILLVYGIWIFLYLTESWSRYCSPMKNSQEMNPPSQPCAAVPSPSSFILLRPCPVYQASKTTQSFFLSSNRGSQMNNHLYIWMSWYQKQNESYWKQTRVTETKAEISNNLQQQPFAIRASKPEVHVTKHRY
jgi:hypothetical protein